MARSRKVPAEEAKPPEVNDARAEVPAAPQNGEVNGERKGPAFKVGPIPTDRNNAVAAAVWANEVTVEGRTFTVYNVTVESRWRDVSGEWKSGKQFRSSQLPTLIYCLQRAFEWACAQRDPNGSPF